MYLATVIYSLVTALQPAFLSTACMADTETHIVQNIHLYLFALRTMAVQSFVVSLKIRFTAMFAMVLPQFAATAIRQAIYDDDLLFMRDTKVLFEFLTILVSVYSFEYIIRSGFIASKQVELALHKSGKYASAARAALNVMLPPFAVALVMARDVQCALRGRPAPGNTTTPPNAASNNSVAPHQPTETNAASSVLTAPDVARDGQDDDADDDDEDDDEMLLWEYPMISVAFLSFALPTLFNSDDVDATNNSAAPDTDVVQSFTSPVEVPNKRNHDVSSAEHIAPMLRDMERIARRHGVTKVKSTSTTMLLVCGVDGTTSPCVSEAAHRMCEAVTDIVAHVFMPHNSCVGAASPTVSTSTNGTPPVSTATTPSTTTATTRPPEPGLEYRVGVHAGSCFGAVLGTRGLTFDVFGDTINTASRIMTTSPPNSVHLSAVAVDCLGGVQHCPLGTTLTDVGAVAMKGKGTMNVWRLDTCEAEKELPRNGLLSVVDIT
eukprot:PhM_4_TR10444/c1_g2_i7/m.72497